jgi:hypothetical protein
MSYGGSGDVSGDVDIPATADLEIGATKETGGCGTTNSGNKLQGLVTH